MPRPLLPALAAALVLAPPAAADEFRSISVDPPTLKLAGPTAAWSLLVTGTTPDGRSIDLTAAATFRPSGPEVVATGNLVRAARDGRATVTVTAGGRTASVPVDVTASTAPRAIHFENDVSPVLGRYGCSGSGCHGKAEGQGGFKLSVFGFDPAADYSAIVKEGRGRRVFPGAPDASLLLRKASGQTPHGGGVRIKPDSDDYRTLRDWVAAGTPVGSDDAPKVAGLRVEPAERLMGNTAPQQLRVVARFADGREVDVTRHARFSANDDTIAAVSAGGLVTTKDAPGEVAVMAAYMGEVGLFRSVVPRPGPPVSFAGVPRFNRIDELVDKKLAKLNVGPSAVCDDATFLRRATLDITGTLPTPADVRRFLADSDPTKRAKLVDALLARPAFADLMALKWADVLRVDRTALGSDRAYAYHRWLRDSFAANKPFDRLARELLTAEGPLSENPPANFYKAVPKPGEMASTVAQVFLGVRIACAECHHHPFDRWGQHDYYGMVAYFAPVAARGPKDAEAVAAVGEAKAKHPRTGEQLPPRPLGGEPAAGTGDSRVSLAAWATDPGNPYFARNLANRVWAHLLGRGLVEPVDDARATNPPSNPELLDFLAKHVTESGYDVRSLVRLIAASRAYQTSTRPTDTNAKDERNYSRFPFKRPDAEVLLDAVSQATGVPERFRGVPAGTRAVQLWDSKTSHDFLKLFGRPARATACECERNHEPAVAQVLHLLNSPAVQAKLSHEAGTVAKLVRTTPDDATLVEELYLSFLGRFPDAAERDTAVSHLRAHAATRRKAAEDVAWALLNTLEFGFNH